MRLNFLRTLGLALFVAVCYSACNKSSNKPTANANDLNVAKQIALSLNQSLTGQLGGTNINDGPKAPSSIIPGKKGKTLNDLNPLCGLVIDTAYTSLQTAADTTDWLSGKFHFVYNCSTTYVDGYTVYDSLKTENQSSKFLDEYTNIQKYTLKATDSTYTSSTLNGSISTSLSYQNFSAPKVQSSFYALDCTYTLTGLLIVKIDSGTDITAGTASFTSSVESVVGVEGTKGSFQNYAGSIQYLGNHTAKLLITNGGTYMINFSTGSVIQI